MWRERERKREKETVCEREGECVCEREKGEFPPYSATAEPSDILKDLSKLPIMFLTAVLLGIAADQNHKLVSMATLIKRLFFLISVLFPLINDCGTAIETLYYCSFRNPLWRTKWRTKA